MTKINSSMDKFEDLMKEVVFTPSASQREAKAAFWASYRDNPLSEVKDLTKADVMHITQDSRIGNWWNAAGFKEWFTDQAEFRKKIELAGDLALDALVSILGDDMAKVSDKIRAAQLALQVRDKTLTDAKEEKYADEAISRMNEEQLQRYIEQQTKKLKHDN